jgi:transposase-like protein
MTMKEIKTLKGRRKFDAAFKREAVAHWVASGKSAEAVGEELGIGAERLYAWKPRFVPPTAVEAVDLRAQLEATQRELARVSEQRDILKKTLGILSEPLPKSTPGLKP